MNFAGPTTKPPPKVRPLISTGNEVNACISGFFTNKLIACLIEIVDIFHRDVIAPIILSSNYQFDVQVCPPFAVSLIARLTKLR